MADELIDKANESLASAKRAYNKKLEEYAKTGKTGIDNLTESISAHQFKRTNLKWILNHLIILMENNLKTKTQRNINNKLTADLKANWNEISGKIRDTFPNVSDRDLQFMSQGEDELIGRLQMKSGKTKAQIRNWIQSSRIM